MKQRVQDLQDAWFAAEQGDGAVQQEITPLYVRPSYGPTAEVIGEFGETYDHEKRQKRGSYEYVVPVDGERPSGRGVCLLWGLVLCARVWQEVDSTEAHWWRAPLVAPAAATCAAVAELDGS